MASFEEIEKILKDMRDAIDKGLFIPVKREDNRKTLALLGYTWKNAMEEIKSLETSDYYQGPMIDRDYPQSDKLWVFKKDIGNNLIYIKFKVEYLADNGVKVISFHLDKP